eukprot:551359_1
MATTKAFTWLQLSICQQLDVTNKIKSCVSSSNVEMLLYQLKNGEHDEIVQDFNNKIMNFIDDFIEETENKTNEDFVKTIYDYMVELVIHSFKEIENEWNCANCGNKNFRKYIGGKMEHTPTWCSLCGLTQKTSLLLNIKK